MRLDEIRSKSSHRYARDNPTSRRPLSLNSQKYVMKRMEIMKENEKIVSTISHIDKRPRIYTASPLSKPFCVSVPMSKRMIEVEKCRDIDLANEVP